MKKRPQFGKIVQEIGRFSPEMKGVFRNADLFSIIRAADNLKTYRIIKRLVDQEIIFRVQRGFYITKDVDLWTLAFRLDRNCYISMDSVLSKNLLIGTIPAHVVRAVRPGRGEKIATPFGNVFFYSISRDLDFGFKKNDEAICVADSEKAFIDALYFYSRGHRFVCDPRVDIDIWKLNRKKVGDYLKRYRNPKFVKFVKGVIRDE